MCPTIGLAGAEPATDVDCEGTDAYFWRDPNILYLEWIRIMNQNGGDYRGMISGFMNSIEYRKRFGQ